MIPLDAKPTEANLDTPGDRGAPRLESSALHLLHRVVQIAGDIFADEMGPGGLTPRQFAILLTVSQHEGASQTNLVRLTGIDRSTLADIIRRMLKKGLLARRRTSQDARAYSVRPTQAGLDALAAAEPAANIADQRILAALPEDQRQTFLTMLNNIIGTIRRPADD